MLEKQHLKQLEEFLPCWTEISSQATRQKKAIFLVGGALRDLLLGRPLHELDFVCPRSEIDFWENFFTSRITGSRFISLGHREQQVRRLVGAGPNLDLAGMDGSDLKEDLRRRDFTINAMAWDPRLQTGHDPFNGQHDLKAGRIDCVKPENLLADPLRLVRAVRFALALNGQISADCLQAMPAAAKKLNGVARERFTPELKAILVSPQAADGLETLEQCGALSAIFPALKKLAGLEQNNFHHLDAMQHTLATIRALDQICLEDPFADRAGKLGPEDIILIKWTALLHDCGKALTQTVDPDDGRIHFYGHEKFSTHLAREILPSFALEKKFIERLCRLIENHLRPLLLNPETVKDKSLRQLVFDLEGDLELLLLHAWADLEASHGRNPEPRQRKLLLLGRRLKEIFERERSQFIKPLLAGRDLLALGLKPGPEIGVIIRLIHQQQLDGRINSRAEALNAARELLAEK